MYLAGTGARERESFEAIPTTTLAIVATAAEYVNRFVRTAV